MYSGVLEVIVFRGRDIPLKKSEPPTTFCTIEIGKEIYGTKQVENSQNPEWCTLSKFKDADMDKHVSICVRDKKENFLGKVEIPLKYLEKEKTSEKWYPLLNKKLEQDSKIKGEIEVKLKYYPSNLDRKKENNTLRAKDREETQRKKLFGGKTAIVSKISENDKSMTESDDVEEMEKKINAMVEETSRVRQESKSSTARTLQTIHASEEVGANSLEKLNTQGDQMKRIIDETDQIESDLKMGNRYLRGISSIFGSTANVFSKKPKSSPKTSSKNKQTPLGKSFSTDKSSPRFSKKMEEKEKLDKTINNDNSNTNSNTTIAKEPIDNEIDRDLDEISESVLRLKGIAVEMGKEIDSHTEIINKLDTKVENNTNNIRSFNQRIRRI